VGSPRVSVLLPFDGLDEALLTSLESLRRQTLEDWEGVLVANGPAAAALAGRPRAQEPPALEALRFLLALDRRFRLLLLPEGEEGLVAVLNHGWAACRGPFVARMDADDCMHPERLERQAAFLEENPRLAGCGCHPRLFPRSELGPGILEYEAWLCSLKNAGDVWRDRFIECPLAHPSLVFRREALPAVPYRDRGWPEDWDLVLRILGHGPLLGVVPEPLLAWRRHAGNLHRWHPAYTQDRFLACRAVHLARQFLAGRQEYVLWGYGGTGRRLSAALQRLGCSCLWIVELHPRRLGQRIRSAEVIPPEGLAEVPVSVPVVVSVAGLEARTEIRMFLERIGRVEGVDFVVAA